MAKQSKTSKLPPRESDGELRDAASVGPDRGESPPPAVPRPSVPPAPPMPPMRVAVYLGTPAALGGGDRPAGFVLGHVEPTPGVGLNELINALRNPRLVRCRAEEGEK